MVIDPGEKVSHYIIVSAIASGGMGSVYLAKDTKLDRRVAIKFLRRDFSERSDALWRFLREAKAASSLNHPNIITIHEIGEWDGSDFIAMEFVEGRSLRELIELRHLDLPTTLDIAIQTGSALAAAHDAGIVHRDIKPENIIVRPDNLVKVLDFGLAKRLRTPVPADGIDPEAPTGQLMDTAAGFVIGTAAYMSPEQARGKPTDERTDIWSLGVVLYEMISGDLPFPGETKSDMIAAILKSEPQPLSTHSFELAHEFEHVIKKALGKDREQRYQVIKDLVLDLKLLKEELKTQENGNSSGQLGRTAILPLSTREVAAYRTTGRDPNRPIFPFIIAAAILIAVAAGWYFWPGRGASEDTQFSSLTSTQVTSWKSAIGEDGVSRPRLSPDGKLLAYVASRAGLSTIWLKQLDGGEPFTRMQEGSADYSPIWSPDQGQIAYYSDRGGRRGIWAAPALGGPPTLLASLDSRGSLVHWSEDGATIFFKMSWNLYSLEIAAKEIRKLTSFDESRVMEHGFSVSPDETRIAYIDRQNGQTDLWVSGLNGQDPLRVTDDPHDDSMPIWHPDGKRIIYNSSRNGVNQIFVVFIDSKRQAQLSLSDTDSHVADISKDGTKVLYTTTKDDADLWSIPADGGKESQVTSSVGAEVWPDISPDGTKIAYQQDRRLSTARRLLNSVLVAGDVKSEDPVPQIAQDGFNIRWSPDGKNLSFLRNKSGNQSLWVISSDGLDERQVSEGGVMFGGYLQLPYNRLQSQDYQWSPDGGSLIYSAVRDGISNVWQTFLDGAGEIQLTRNSDKKLLFFNPVFSPDGKRIAWSGMTTDTPDKRIWSIWTTSDGAERALFQLNSIVRLLGWSASGEQLIVRSVGNKNDTGLPEDVSVFAIDLEGSGTRPLSTLKSSYFQNIALSPDRRSLAFVSRLSSGDSIQILGIANPSPKTLVSGNDSRVYFSNLLFAPDGKTLYYGKQSNSQVISMIDNFR